MPSHAHLLVAFVSLGWHTTGGFQESPSQKFWAGFRGDGTSQTAEQIPLRWSTELNVGWTRALEGYGQSSPVCWDEHLFVTSVLGSRKETLRVVALDASTGETRWQLDRRASVEIPSSNYVSRGAPTPVVDHDGVYLFFECGDLFALSHQGQPKWERQLSREFGEYQGNHGLGASLAQTSELVLVAVCHDGPSYLMAVDKRDGSTRWKADLPSKVSWCSPIVSGDLVVLNGGGRLAAYSTQDGRALWEVTGLEGNTVSSATITDKFVIAGADSVGSNFAVRRGGQGDVTDTHVAWRSSDATSSFGSPVVSANRVYFVSKAGIGYCVSLLTGETLWKHRLEDSCWASPIATQDRVYFFGKGGTTTVVAHADQFQELARNSLPTQEPVVGVAVSQNRLFIRTPVALHCIAAAKSVESK